MKAAGLTARVACIAYLLSGIYGVVGFLLIIGVLTAATPAADADIVPAM